MRRALRAIHLAGVLLVVLLTVSVWRGPIRPAFAGEAEDAQQLVDKARMTMDAFVADKDMGPPSARRVLAFRPGATPPRSSWSR